MGMLFLYFGFYGISGFGFQGLHILSVADSSGLHYFVDAYEQGGPYTDFQASISTSRIVNVPSTLPVSQNSFVAAAWIACEQRAGNSNPTWFMQVGWYSVAQNLNNQPIATFYDTVFWAASPTYEVNAISSIAPGEVHNYEIKQETEGWHLIVDGTTVKVIAETGTCTMIDVCDELTSPQPSQWSPAAIDCGQIVFSNLEVTAGGSTFPFLQPVSGTFAYSIDAGGNGLSYQSPTQLTEGWGLSTSPGNPSWGSNPTPTPSPNPSPSPSSTPQPSPSSSSPSSGNSTSFLDYLASLFTEYVEPILGDSPLMMLGAVFTTGLSTIMLFWPKHKRENSVKSRAKEG